jgi:hypothetical protein
MIGLSRRVVGWSYSRVGKKGTVSDSAVDSDFFVYGIEDQVLDLVQFAVPPGIQLLIEQLSGSTDLRAGNV